MKADELLISAEELPWREFDFLAGHGSMSDLAIKRQIDFPDGREFRSTGPHVRNPGACGSRRTADVTHSRCVGRELSFHPWMSARRIGGGRLLTFSVMDK